MCEQGLDLGEMVDEHYSILARLLPSRSFEELSRVRSELSPDGRRSDARGYEYLSLVRPDCHDVVAAKYGTYPIIEEFLRIGLSSVDLSKVLSSKVLDRRGVWELSNEGIDLGIVFRAVARVSSETYLIGSLGAWYQVTSRQFPPNQVRVAINDRIGVCDNDPRGDCESVVGLNGQQCGFEPSRPIAKEPVQIPGSAVSREALVGPSAVKSESRVLIHDSSDLRGATTDIGARVVVSTVPCVDHFGVAMIGSDTSGSFRQRGDDGPFQSGYCYLAYIRRDLWGYVAEILGANPKLKSLYKVMIWAGETCARRLSLVRVSDQFYHVDDECGAEFVVDGGRFALVQVLSAICQRPDARIGGWRYGRGMSRQHGEFDKLVKEAKSAVVRSVSGAYGADMGFLWLNNDDCSTKTSFDRLAAHKSGVLVADPDFVLEESGGWISLKLEVANRAMVVLPRGCKLHRNGVTYGQPGTQFAFGFREWCDVMLDFTHVIGEFVHPLVLTGSRVKWALDFMLDPKSTKARFVRACGTDVVLKFPFISDISAGAHDWKVVPITDPLSDWNAIAESRVESGSYGARISYESESFVCFKNFRSLIEACANVGEFARFSDTDAGVTVPETGHFSAVPTVECRLEHCEWSIRQLVCVDEYCMDRGGPSDFEFSDAV